MNISRFAFKQSTALHLSSLNSMPAPPLPSVTAVVSAARNGRRVTLWQRNLNFLSQSTSFTIHCVPHVCSRRKPLTPLPVCTVQQPAFSTASSQLHSHNNQGGNTAKEHPNFTDKSNPEKDSKRQSASSHNESSPPSTNLSAKRKSSRTTGAKNSLRRVAIIAQQPSRLPATRSAPTETPAPEWHKTVRAICSAESYDMDRVTEILTAHGFTLDPDNAGFEAHEVIHARGAGSGDIFVFPSGAVVTWGLSEEAATSLATTQLLPAALESHVDKSETDTLEFRQDTDCDTSYMRGEVLVLGTKHETQQGVRLDTTLAKIAFSSGLARSTKLSVLESGLMDYFESTREIPHMLARNEKVPLGKGFILQKTGELLSLRARLNHYSELTDSLPDLFWDSRQELGLEGYYEEIGRALDVNVRIRTLNQKMDYAQEIATVLREMSSEKHNTRLEWIIILLIAVEVLFELRRAWCERREEKHLETIEDEVTLANRRNTM